MVEKCRGAALIMTNAASAISYQIRSAVAEGLTVPQIRIAHHLHALEVAAAQQERIGTQTTDAAGTLLESAA